MATYNPIAAVCGVPQLMIHLPAAAAAAARGRHAHNSSTAWRRVRESAHINTTHDGARCPQSPNNHTTSSPQLRHTHAMHAWQPPTTAADCARSSPLFLRLQLTPAHGCATTGQPDPSQHGFGGSECLGALGNKVVGRCTSRQTVWRGSTHHVEKPMPRAF
jgi:hypothetical protein